MIIPLRHRTSIAAALLVAAASSPALAQEATAPPAATETEVTTSLASVTVHTGYQASNHEALTGINQSLIFGLRLGPPDSSFVQFLEFGISRLDVEEGPLVTSSALVGGRFAWRWNRLALHLFARIHQGDAVPGDDEVAIYSHSSSLGLMASFDIWRRGGHAMSLGAHAIGQLHDAGDGEDTTLAGAGGGGLSLVVW